MFQAIKLFLIVVILALFGAGAWYVMKLQNDNAILKSNEEKLTTAIEEQKAVIKQTQESYEKILDSNRQLNDTIAEATKAKEELQNKLAKHDLNFLAKEKPVLVEKIINRGSQKVLDEIQDITK